jgi:DNA-binding transcriptional MerR regulator
MNTKSQSTQDLYSISEIARNFNISTRTLRFYEDKHLLSPHRQGKHRLYDNCHKSDLRILLRYKRLGFDLQTISELLRFYHLEKMNSAELNSTRNKLTKHINELEKYSLDLKESLREFHDIHDSLGRRLDIEGDN